MNKTCSFWFMYKKAVLSSWTKRLFRFLKNVCAKPQQQIIDHRYKCCI